MKKPENGMSENELILLAQAGNDQALELIIRLHLPAVYALCCRYMGNTDDAQDAAQETFVKVWRNLKKIDPQKKFRSWIMEIAKNNCLDELKKKRAVPMSSFESADGTNPYIDSLESLTPSPADITEHSILRRVLTAAVDKLAPIYRDIINLYFGKNLNLREISETLNEPLNTVKSRHRRALLELRMILAKND